MTAKRFFAVFLLVSLVLAGIVSHYASSDPDGLEKVAEEHGITAEEKEHSLGGSPLGDYGVRGVADERLSVGLSGVIGVGATLLLGGGLFWGLRRRGPAPAPRDGTPAGSAQGG